MTTAFELPVGLRTWPLTVRPDQVVELRHEPIAAPKSEPQGLLRAALDQPFGIEAPMRRAVTPEDRVAIVLDEKLPHVADLLAGLVEHLMSAKVDPSAITVVLPPGGAGGWMDELPDEYCDIHLETHDPEDREKLAYLATTKAGRRIYLNRTVVDADFVVVLSGRRFDPSYGYTGAEAMIFPALGEAEVLVGLVGNFSHEPPSKKPTEARAEAMEVAWLLGTPFLIQVIEGSGDSIHDVIVGLPDSTGEGVNRQNRRWRATIAEQPDLVVAAVPGSPERLDFLALASALANAARVVASGGRIVLLSNAAPTLNEGAELLRQLDEPGRVARLLAKRKPDDWPAAALWAFAAEQARLFIASSWPDEVTEELFATPISSSAEVQRLIDAAPRVLIVPDAHKTVIEVV
jgi:nickel-dependent lactate racemase